MFQSLSTWKHVCVSCTGDPDEKSVNIIYSSRASVARTKGVEPQIFDASLE